MHDLLSKSLIHLQDSPTPRWEKTETSRKRRATTIVAFPMAPSKALYIHFEISDALNLLFCIPSTLMVRPMPFFFFIMGHGSWLLKSFSFWRQSLIFQRFFWFKFRSLFICYDFKVKKWFLLVTRKVLPSQLGRFDLVNSEYHIKSTEFKTILGLSLSFRWYWVSSIKLDAKRVEVDRTWSILWTIPLTHPSPLVTAS